MTHHELNETTSDRSPASSVKTSEVDCEGNIDQGKENQMINITQEDHKVLRNVMCCNDYETGEEFVLKELVKMAEGASCNEAPETRSVSSIVTDVFGGNWMQLASYLDEHLETQFNATVVVTLQLSVPADSVEDAHVGAEEWRDLDCHYTSVDVEEVDEDPDRVFLDYPLPKYANASS